MKSKENKKPIIAIAIVVLIIVAIVLAVIGINALESSLKQEAERKNEVVVGENDGNVENGDENSNLDSNTSSNSSSNQISQNNVPKALEDNENVKIWIDASGAQVPVPIGYVGSKVDGENEIDTGYVIYEGTTDVTSSNVATARTTRNQYVWVPVPDVHEMHGTDENGKKWGKLYDFGTSSSPKNPPTALNWSETGGVMRITSSTRYREPDILTSEDKDSQLRTYNIGIKSMNELELELEKEFNRMIISVEKYGGFYIGRYETGNLSQNKPAVVKENSDISNQTWYTIYKKSKRLANGNEHVRTSMIYGSQWDATLKWFLTSKNEEIRTYVTNSSGKGNYRNEAITYVDSTGATVTKNAYTSKIIPTGSSEQTKVNNIYDMAGNVYDWTIEAYHPYQRSCYSPEVVAAALQLQTVPPLAGAATVRALTVPAAVVAESHFM